MKKMVLLLFLTILFLAGCGTQSVRYSGESDNWAGEYAATIEDTSEHGEYLIHYKNGSEDMVIEDVVITIKEKGGKKVSRMDELREATITMPSSCSGCAVNDKDHPIEVIITWMDKEESFTLTAD